MTAITTHPYFADEEHTQRAVGYLRNKQIHIFNALRQSSQQAFNFSGQDFSGVDLRGAKLDLCNFKGANLSKARLEGTDLRGTIFKEADLTGAQFDKDTSLGNTNFEKATLTDAKFYHTTVSLTHFDKADLQRADFRYAELTRCRFNGANLRQADIDFCRMNECYFANADMTGVRTTHALLDPRTSQEHSILTAQTRPPNVPLPRFLHDKRPSRDAEGDYLYQLHIPKGKKLDEVARPWTARATASEEKDSPGIG